MTIHKALLEIQKTLPSFHADATGHHKNAYATLSNVLDVVRGPLADAGVTITQPIDVDESGVVTVSTVLTHVESGESVRSSLPVALEGGPQAIGSLYSYYRRYTCLGLLAITPALDDDGQAAQVASSKKAPSTKKKAASKKAPSESEKAAKWDEFQSCFESASAGTAAYSAFVEEHGKPETQAQLELLVAWGAKHSDKTERKAS
jgi:hypothetical protein